MRFLLLTTLLACSSDIAIITTEKNNDTSDVITEEPSSTVSAEPSAQPSSEPAGQPTSEPSSEMTDLSIGFAKIHFRQISCPACVGAAGEFDIKATLNLHYPTSGDYFDLMTPVGTCTTNLIENYVGSQPLPATQPATFNSISLNPVGQGEWANNYLYEYQIQRQTPHTITSENGTIINAFTTSEGFDDIQPYTLLWVDPSYAFDAVISKNGTYFSWYPVLTGDQFEILIAVYSPDGAQLLGAVSCMENDIGSMMVPGTYFQAFPYWSLAAVHLIRHRIDSRPAPEYNGWIDSHMIWEVIGTGHIE
tara:strand:+ start:22 stop:939 length:918 start_codon:yes stop_codon:yes gene_type:complete